LSETHSSELVLGWDVGGTKSAALIATAGGQVLSRREWPSLAQRGPEPMIREFIACARELLAAAGGKVAGIGVSVGGPVNPLTGVVLSPPHLPKWDRVPVVDILHREFGLPVVVEHDAAACLLAEWLWGAVQGATHAVYLTCGTGCGAGVLIGGRILRGPDGQSPEVGHIRLAPDGPMMFGKAGCTESFCSGEGIGKLAGWMFPQRFGPGTDTRLLAQLTADGDADARAVLVESARRTGQLCALLADTFSPQIIALGSLARYFGTWWCDEIERAFRAEALADNSRHTRIVPAELGERLQDLSAVAAWLYRKRPPAAGE
jgi:glucokinase